MARLIDSIKGHQNIRDKFNMMLDLNRIPNSLIFSGPSGVGKKSMALAFAQTLLCEKHKDRACGECGACCRVFAGQNESLMLIEPKGSQIKIEQARQVIQFLNLRSITMKRVVVIDEAHLLNPQSANALLKSIEEPPAGVHFILIVQTLSSLLPTIISRSQVLRFNPLTRKEISEITKAPDWVLNSCMGRVDQALKLMEQDQSQELRSLSLNFWKSFVENRGQEYLSAHLEAISDKQQSQMTALYWRQLLRDAMVYHVDSSKCIHADYISLIEQLSGVGMDSLQKIEALTSVLDADLQTNVDKKLCFENFCIQSQQVCFT